VSAALLFSNLAPSVSKAYLLGVFDGNHKFGKRERKSEWSAQGGSPDGWGRSFTVICISDKNKSDLEYLLEVDEDGQRLNTFTIPEDLTPDNIEMYQTGEMTRTFTQVEQYINA